MSRLNRRSFLKATAGSLLGAAARASAAADATPQGACRSIESPSPVQVVNVGDLSVLFGDSTAHGMRGRGYCGIWSLGSAHEPHNGFVSSAAGFIFSSHRGRPVKLRRLSERQVEFRLKEPTLHSRVLFTAGEPHYVDSQTTVVPQVQVNAPYLLQSWASYMNSPRDGDIYFVHEGKWIKAHSPHHGVEATFCPASLKDTEEDLRHLSPEERRGFFAYGYSQQRFSEPFYFGRIRHMALAFFFDTSDHVRFTISPVGGGVSILPGNSCPAWDWLWLIPHPKVGKAYTLRVRMIYKHFVSREDILEEFTRWRSGLGRPRQAGT